MDHSQLPKEGVNGIFLIAAEGQMRTRMIKGQQGLFPIGHHRRHKEAAAVGLHKGPPALGTPVAILQRQPQARPGLQQQDEQTLVGTQAKAGQDLQQKTACLFALQAKPRLAAHPARRQHIGTASRPFRHPFQAT